jgi:hypothetical protein
MSLNHKKQNLLMSETQPDESQRIREEKNEFQTLKIEHQ